MAALKTCLLFLAITAICIVGWKLYQQPLFLVVGIISCIAAYKHADGIEP
jgi:1,4-dihydroxy-2-naphthoate octaprenyltransferase